MARDNEKLPAAPSQPAGVNSIEVGAALLREIAKANGPMKLTDLAAGAGMSTSRAYKYLASFVRCGLVRQSQPSGRYGIGPLAAELGFSALRNIEIVELAQDVLDDLRDDAQAVTSLTIWSAGGPIVVRRSAYDRAVSLIVQLGAVLTMTTSSDGRVFAAFGQKETTGSLIKQELGSRDGPARLAGLRSMADVHTMLDGIRAQGFASMESPMMQRGIVSVSAPVFDYTGALVAAVALTGIEGQLDISTQGSPVRLLLEATGTLSRSLGARAAKAPGDFPASSTPHAVRPQPVKRRPSARPA